MVRIIEGKKTYNYPVNKYDEILTEAHSQSNKILLHFFDIIGLDRSLFTHLTNIESVLDLEEFNDYDTKVAFYECVNSDDHTFDNTIHMLPEYLDTILDRYDDINRNDLIKTILHETIHANRTIIINNAVLYPDCTLSSISHYEKFRERYAHLIHDSNNKLQVLRVFKSKSSSSYTIYAYNSISGDFFIYTIPTKYGIVFNNLNDFEELLNRSSQFFDFIAQIENPYDINYTSLVADYSTSFKDPTKLESKDYMKIDGEVTKQMDFEESITEAFVQIMFYLKDKDEFNFDELLQKNHLPANIKLALEFIHNLNIDTIRWFFLSCYEDEYRNRFYELYKDEYFRLIDKFSEAYNKVLYNEDYPNFDSTLEFIRQLKK